MYSERKAVVNNLVIGADAPVRVQTMYDSQIADTDTDEVIRRIRLLEAMGCDLIRFSYVSSRDRDNFTKIVKESPIPVVADIHFDYKLAIEALECGAPKIRIDPGDIGRRWKTEEVVKAALDKGACIRIGLNSGSLPHNTLGKDVPSLMADTAMEYLSWFEGWGFENSVVSLKASDPEVTLKANRLLKQQCTYPIHLGVTEAGGAVTSCIRSAWALGNLLKEGIGDTIRVSITGSIETEVQAAGEILRTLGLRKGGVRIVSCPRCGRHTFDSQAFLSKVEPRLLSLKKNITVAIMGCQVNGPGEAKNADVAVTGIGNRIFLYRNGELLRDVEEDKAEDALFDTIESL